MGIFSQNIKSSLYTETVKPAHGYGGADAGAKIKLEGYQNDMALFTAIIESDFNAAKATHEGAVNEATLITEGTVGNMFKKIADLFKKLWEKLKGMIQSFIVKFVAVFVRDNKELVKKYHKQIVKQLADDKKKYAEMEYKMTRGYCEYLNGKSDVPGLDLEAMANSFGSTTANVDANLEDLKEKADKSLVAHINKSLKINISELADMKKELDDKYIGEKEDCEGYDSALNKLVEDELTRGAKTIKSANDIKSDVDKICKKLVSAAEKQQKEADKEVDDVEKRALKVKEANLAYYEASSLQSVMTDVTTWKLGFFKGALKEIRALYVKAVSRRSVSEDADLLESIIDEAVEYDVESIFEADVEADLNDDDLSAEVDSIEDIADEKCDK